MCSGRGAPHPNGLFWPPGPACVCRPEPPAVPGVLFSVPAELRRVRVPVVADGGRHTVHRAGGTAVRSGAGGLGWARDPRGPGTTGQGAKASCRVLRGHVDVASDSGSKPLSIPGGAKNGGADHASATPEGGGLSSAWGAPLKPAALLGRKELRSCRRVLSGSEAPQDVPPLVSSCTPRPELSRGPSRDTGRLGRQLCHWAHVEGKTGTRDSQTTAGASTDDGTV